jgi:flagellar biosynthetic protein FlhB
MSDADKDQKTEQPTEKRLSESHDRGEFAKSADMGVVFSLAAACGALAVSVDSSALSVGRFAAMVFGNIHAVDFNGAEIPLPLFEAGRVMTGVLVPILSASVVAALLSGGLQSGFRLTLEAVGFKPEKLNPVAGLGRVFSQRSLVQAGVDFAKMIAVGLCVWGAAQKLLGDPIFTTPVPAAYLGQFMQEGTLLLMVRLLLILGVLTSISYTYERYKTRRDKMMSPHEVKEEHKQAEGNAQVKMAMRRMARRLLQKQMLEAVPMADVVITNPTHYAVALKYERGKDSAPIVLAKGENALARRIKAIASEHEVPLVENRPVARLLYAAGKVGEPIPTELYQAIAGILAFVYRTYRYYFYRLSARRMAAAQSGT